MTTAPAPADGVAAHDRDSRLPGQGRCLPPTFSERLPGDDLGGDELRGLLPWYLAGTYELEVSDSGGRVLARGSIDVTDAASALAP